MTDNHLTFLTVFQDVITGPSEGSMGAAAAIALAYTNPKAIYLLGRTAQRINPVISRIKEISPSTIAEFVKLDTADNVSVHNTAENLKALLAKSSEGEIHGLVNSAGIMATKEYRVSKDGVEGQFATNHLGHFLLTNLLKEELLKGKAVVLQVSSGGFFMTDSNFEDATYKVSPSSLFRAKKLDIDEIYRTARSMILGSPTLAPKPPTPCLLWLWRSAWPRQMSCLLLARQEVSFSQSWLEAGNSLFILLTTATAVNDSSLRKNNDVDDEMLMAGFHTGKNKGEPQLGITHARHPHDPGTREKKHRSIM